MHPIRSLLLSISRSNTSRRYYFPSVYSIISSSHTHSSCCLLFPHNYFSFSYSFCCFYYPNHNYRTTTTNLLFCPPRPPRPLSYIIFTNCRGIPAYTTKHTPGLSIPIPNIFVAAIYPALPPVLILYSSICRAFSFTLPTPCQYPTQPNIAVIYSTLLIVPPYMITLS